MVADLICLAGETFDTTQDLTIFDPIETWKRTTLEGGTYSMEEQLVKVFDHGQYIYHSPSVMEIRRHFFEELDKQWDESKRLINPHRAHIDLSDRLFNIKRELMNRR